MDHFRKHALNVTNSSAVFVIRHLPKSFWSYVAQLLMDEYNADDDVLAQACNSLNLPRGPDPVWYLPIKNMDTAALELILSSLDLKEREKLFGWECAAQWQWQIRTALGYAIWRRNISAVKTLISFGADVKENVAQEESSSCHYDGGIQFSSLAYCVHCQWAEPIPLLINAGASKEDWQPNSDLYNFDAEPLREYNPDIDDDVEDEGANGPYVPPAFWKSGGEEVTRALELA